MSDKLTREQAAVNLARYMAQHALCDIDIDIGDSRKATEAQGGVWVPAFIWVSDEDIALEQKL